MVMMDDNSATMVAAVKEGRTVFENIKGKKLVGIRVLVLGSST